MTTMEVRDVGLRESVTPRAVDISDRIAMVIQSSAGERRLQLEEWAIAIDYTIAWGRDLTASEYAEWKAKLG